MQEQNSESKAIVIQCCVRSYLSRKFACQRAQHIIEKIYDPKTFSHYYYNSKLDTSRWTVPFFLSYAHTDISNISTSYTQTEAACLIQRQMHKNDAKSRKTISDNELCDASVCDNELNVINYAVPNRSKMQQLIDQIETTRQLGSTLNLSKLSTPHISHRIFKLEPYLITLNLSHNQLTRISKRIGLLKALIHLDLSYNQIRKLPIELKELRELRELYVGHNFIKEFPISLYKLHQLKCLSVSHNKIEEIGIGGDLSLIAEEKTWEFGIGLMKNIETFDASDNNIADFPKHLEFCEKLTQINLSKNNLEAIPDCFGNLCNLKFLNMSQNRIKLIPTTCKLWSNIEDLIFNRNDFDIFPGEVLTNGWRNCLNTLDLSFNKIKEIPESVQNLLKLKKLNCMNNNISKVSEKIDRLGRLQSLDFSVNILIDLPSSISFCKKMTRLRLDRNRLRHLPNGVCQLFSLSFLSVSNNDIEQLSVGSLLSLQYLNASSNKLEEMPSGLSGRTTLQVLDLSHNKISIISNGVGNLKHLKHLNLAYNFIEFIPLEVKHLEKLQVCQLNNNKIKYSDCWNIRKFKDAVSLDMSGNWSTNQETEKTISKKIMNIYDLFSKQDVLQKAELEMFLLNLLSLIQKVITEVESSNYYITNKKCCESIEANPYFCHAIVLTRIAKFHMGMKMNNSSHEGNHLSNKEICFSGKKHNDIYQWLMKALDAFDRCELYCKEFVKLSSREDHRLGGHIYFNRAKCYLNLADQIHPEQSLFDPKSCTKYSFMDCCGFALRDVDESIARCPNNYGLKRLRTHICMRIGKFNEVILNAPSQLSDKYITETSTEIDYASGVFVDAKEINHCLEKLNMNIHFCTKRLKIHRDFDNSPQHLCIRKERKSSSIASIESSREIKDAQHLQSIVKLKIWRSNEILYSAKQFRHQLETHS